MTINMNNTINLSQPGQPIPSWIRPRSNAMVVITHVFKLDPDTYIIHVEPCDNSGECEIELVRRHGHDGMHFLHTELLPEEARCLYEYIAILFVHLVHGPASVVK